MNISKAPLSHQKHYSIILLHSQEKSLPEDPYLMSEQKDMILENFLSSAIRTLDTDEIYNILMDSLILLLHPQGLLLFQT